MINSNCTKRSKTYPQSFPYNPLVKCKNFKVIHESHIQSVTTHNEFIQVKKFELFENTQDVTKCLCTIVLITLSKKKKLGSYTNKNFLDDNR
jgi:hypothetical protein